MSATASARPRPAHWHSGRRFACHHSASACARDDAKRVQLPALPLRWDEMPQRGNTCALSAAGPYVISHRRGCFTLCYRPVNQHHYVSTSATLYAAKVAASEHAENLAARALWRPASGHPGGWRVCRDVGGKLEELETADAKRVVLFRSCASAKRRADEMNAGRVAA